MSKTLASLSTLCLACSLSSACGSGDSDGTNTQFVGTWQYSSGTSTLSCGDQVYTSPSKGTFTMSEGLSSDLVMQEGDCAVRLDTKGSIATVLPGQNCQTVSDGQSASITISMLSITVNGTIANYSQSGTIQWALATGNLACTYTETATLQKISK